MKPLLQALLLLLMLSTAWGAGASDENRLLTVGLNLFPNIVSIDEEIAEKVADDGNIYLLITYESQPLQATKLAEKLRAQVTSIKKHPVKIAIVKISELHNFAKRVSGVFISEWVNDELLTQAIDYAHQHHALLFSPVVGDVERGVTMGMKITSKIWPYCNTKSLKESNIRFHPSFSKIMKCYDE